MGRDHVQEGDISRDVRANDGVADAFERDLGTFFLQEQRLFHELALDGITQGSQQPSCLDLPFDEIVLRPILQGFHGQRLVIVTRQHNQGNPRRGGTGAQHRLQPFGIG